METTQDKMTIQKEVERIQEKTKEMNETSLDAPKNH